MPRKPRPEQVAAEPAATAEEADEDDIVERPHDDQQKDFNMFGDRTHFVISGDVAAPDEYNYDWTDTLNKEILQFLTTKR